MTICYNSPQYYVVTNSNDKVIKRFNRINFDGARDFAKQKAAEQNSTFRVYEMRKHYSEGFRKSDMKFDTSIK